MSLINGQKVNFSALSETQAESCAELIPDTAMDRWSATKIVSVISSKTDTLCLAASTGKELLGFALFSRVLDEMELLYIAVDARHSGKGIATALLTEALSETKNKITKVFLEVRRSNLPAINLYKKFGFEQIGERKNYYSVTNSEAPVSPSREDALLFALLREGSELQT